MIVVVDYGMGNLASLLNIMKKIGVKALISSSISDIEKADKLVLPGVGAFDNGMKNLNDLGVLPVLSARVLQDKVPILGVCLGMQLFTKKSQEGTLPGLGWIDAETVRFKFEGESNKLKVPHMGWNIARPLHCNSLFQGLEKDARFYFVHSYHVMCNRDEDVLGRTHYGYDFVSAIQKENIMGTQFHPEKSHKFGKTLLKSFVEFQKC
jgi:glutamine amidotransferase